DLRKRWPWTELIIATRNSNKVRELNALSERELGLPVAGLDRFSDVPEVVEDGDTFEENAIKKAKTVSRFLNRPVVADDSGMWASVVRIGSVFGRYGSGGGWGHLQRKCHQEVGVGFTVPEPAGGGR